MVNTDQSEQSINSIDQSEDRIIQLVNTPDMSSNNQNRGYYQNKSYPNIDMIATTERFYYKSQFTGRRN